MEKEEKLRKLKSLRDTLLEMLRTMKEMKHDVGAPPGQADVPTERSAFVGYLQKAKELCPENEHIQSMVEPSQLLGEVHIAYQALSDFLGWEIEKLEKGD